MGGHCPGFPSVEKVLEGVLLADSPQLLYLQESQQLRPHAPQAVPPSDRKMGEPELGHSAGRGTSLMGGLCSGAPHRPGADFLRAALCLRLFPPHPPSFPLLSQESDLNPEGSPT